MNKRRMTLAALCCFALSGIWLISTAQAQSRRADRDNRQVYRGNIIYIGGPRTFTDFFTLTVDSFTPQEEVNRLLGVLREEGRGDFRAAIGRQKRGTIQVGARLGLDVNAIWITPTDEGRKISALAERWQSFGELRRGSRLTDYPYTYLELWVEDDGRVEGSLFPAAKVRARGNNTLEVENFGIYPARLTNIERRRR